MEGKTVILKLNQQQQELLAKTVAHGAAPDREALIRRALREYAARHPQPKKQDSGAGAGAQP